MFDIINNVRIFHKIWVRGLKLFLYRYNFLSRNFHQKKKKKYLANFFNKLLSRPIFAILHASRAAVVANFLRSSIARTVDRFMVPRIIEIDTVVLHLSTEENDRREFTSGR